MNDDKITDNPKMMSVAEKLFTMQSNLEKKKKN